MDDSVYFYTVKEVADILRCSVDTVRRRLAKGDYVRLGGRGHIRIRRSFIDRLASPNKSAIPGARTDIQRKIEARRDTERVLRSIAARVKQEKDET